MAIDIPGIAIILKVRALLPFLDKGVITHKQLVRWCDGAQLNKIWIRFTTIKITRARSPA